VSTIGIRTTRIRRETRFANSTDGAPSSSNAGFYCEEYNEGLLRIVPSNAGTTYELRVWSFENGIGNDWIEDISERRAIPAGEPYTRMFRVGPVDRVFLQVFALAGGNLNIFWTFS
jgi:hypothetical protein